MKQTLAALVAGLVFGVGLSMSQMISSAKVLAFLDVFGNWDPTLVCVMVGALVVTSIGYKLAFQNSAPFFAPKFFVPARRDLDARLVLGASIFGIGWGLTGYCPGPVMASLGYGDIKTLVFFAAMIAGMLASHFVNKRKGRVALV